MKKTNRELFIELQNLIGSENAVDRLRHWLIRNVNKEKRRSRGRSEERSSNDIIKEINQRIEEGLKR